jgi:UPF0042 nucleotide-binding protein
VKAGAGGRRAGDRLVIVTGLSGSGKTHVLRALEDLGFFCVDNLPTALIPRFAELIRDTPSLRRAALVVDLREPGFTRLFPVALRGLRQRRLPVELLFLEADERTLVRRFSETRRPHPLAVDEPVVEGLRQEREALRPIRKSADRIVDTSAFTVHDLRAWVRERFGARNAEAPMTVTVTSFGYKYGVPAEADLVFDARFLPNPNFVPRLRPQTGEAPAVQRYLDAQPDTARFLRRVLSLLGFVLPRHQKEGRSYVTIAIGCTGGRHRSVMLALRVGEALRRRRFHVQVRHRDARQQ